MNSLKTTAGLLIRIPATRLRTIVVDATLKRLAVEDWCSKSLPLDDGNKVSITGH